MRLRPPSFIVSGQPFPFRAVAGDLNVDLSRAVQVVAHTETEDWMIWNPPIGQSIVDPSRHPEIGDYLKAHYCRIGRVWVNPARLSAISQQEDRLGLLYAPNFHDAVTVDYTSQQIADAVRKAGLTNTQKMDFVALSDVMAFDVEQSMVRLEESYGAVEIDRHEAILAVVEASDWISHEPDSYGNPEHAQMLVQTENGCGYVSYADDLRLSLAGLTTEALSRLQEIPWFTISPGKAINLANVTRVVPSTVNPDSSWVNMGNGITLSCDNRVVAEIQARRLKLS